jgi:ferredoxin
MAHRTVKDGYRQFADRLNLFPQGAPPTDLLFKTLQAFVSEKDAALLAQLPIRPFHADKAAKAWGVGSTEARNTLDRLCSVCLLLDTETQNGTEYVLPPPMAGFFEFSLMRVRGDIDQKLLSELFTQYITVEEDFIKDLMGRGGTPVGRAYVNESVLPEDSSLYVLDYECASEIIKQAEHIAVGMCYCRHKKQHTDGACSAPMDICMTFGTAADALSRHEYARKIDAFECLDLLSLAYEHNLVQFGENVQRHPSFLCNCCGCCCEAMIGARRFGLTTPVETTNFLPEVAGDCAGCGKCVNVCPVEAMALVSANDASRPNRKVAKLDDRVCLGCGVCVRACPSRVIKFKHREKRVLTPVNTTHRAVAMAIEHGKLQNLIFDNQAMASHRAMAAVLGVILKLPPIKQAMASKQMKSRYLAALINRFAPRKWV